MDNTVFEYNEQITRWLLFCGVMAPPVGVLFMIIAWQLTPGYSHLSETISQLGVNGRPHPEVINTGFILFGFLVNCFAYGLYRKLRNVRGIKAVWMLLFICGTGIILSGIFQTDLGPEMFTSLEDTLHTVFSTSAFLGLEIGMLVFARIIYANPFWRPIALISIGIAIINVVLYLVFLLEISNEVEGVIQRIVGGTSLLWLEIIAIRSLGFKSYNASSCD
jgi:hypothetical membrane protein